MNLREELSNKVGKYCAVSHSGPVVTITFIPNWRKDEKDVQKYCEAGKCGMPGKIENVGDDFVSIKYFSGYSKARAIIPFNLLLVEEGAVY